MKSIIVIILLQLGCITLLKGQDSLTTIYGQLIDDETQKGVAYVNIGLLNTPIGTVSREDGEFELKVNIMKYCDSTLYISAIGYESVRYELGTIDTMGRLIVHLTPKVFELESVSIEGKKLKVKQYGIKKTGGGLIVGRLRGLEKAYYIPVKKGRCKIKNLNFCISSGNDTVKYRVNFYNHLGQQPNIRIVEKNLIFTGVSSDEGWINIDLSSEELYFDSDFFIAVELLPILQDGIEKKAVYTG